MVVGNESMDKNARGKMILLAQEIEFAKVLAGNDKRLRDKGIKKLRKWLIARSNGKYGKVILVFLYTFITFGYSFL